MLYEHGNASDHFIIWCWLSIYEFQMFDNWAAILVEILKSILFLKTTDGVDMTQSYFQFAIICVNFSKVRTVFSYCLRNIRIKQCENPFPEWIADWRCHDHRKRSDQLINTNSWWLVYELWPIISCFRYLWTNIGQYRSKIVLTLLRSFRFLQYLSRSGKSLMLMFAGVKMIAKNFQKDSENNS